MIDYYETLELNEDCTKEEIKKSYHKLCLKYHPDKCNDNNDNQKFKGIVEAYEILYNEESRKKYNIQRIFKDIQFTEEEYELLEKYYHKIINSLEFRLFKLIYESIPKDVKVNLWNKFKKENSKQIIVAPKSIDITGLYHDETINLFISYKDICDKVLKVIYIITNNGIYYLFLRDFYKNLIIDNISCKLSIHFFIKE